MGVPRDEVKALQRHCRTTHYGFIARGADNKDRVLRLEASKGTNRNYQVGADLHAPAKQPHSWLIRPTLRSSVKPNATPDWFDAEMRIARCKPCFILPSDRQTELRLGLEFAVQCG
jgi:hypothetical protein